MRPPGAVRATPYAVGGPADRIQAPFSHGKFASRSCEASCAVSRFGSGLIEVGVGGWASRRWRRLQALRRPPIRPITRHWSMFLWWKGLPNSKCISTPNELIASRWKARGECLPQSLMTLVLSHAAIFSRSDLDTGSEPPGNSSQSGTPAAPTTIL